MTEIENALLSALESMEQNHKQITDRLTNALTHLGERLLALEAENLKLSEQIAQLSETQSETIQSLKKQAELHQQQSAIMVQLTKR